MNTALNQHVLVLNRLWQAVNVCTARRALTLLFQGQAQVVVNAEDGSFHTFDFQEWRNISENAPQEESVRTVAFKAQRTPESRNPPSHPPDLRPLAQRPPHPARPQHARKNPALPRRPHLPVRRHSLVSPASPARAQGT